MIAKPAFLAAAATALGAAALLIGAGVQPLEAQIRCDGAYQIVNGQAISTPYCRDTHLAQVANQFYGIRVTAREIRWDVHAKARVCRMIGHDIRVRDACSGYRPEDDSRRFVP